MFGSFRSGHRHYEGEVAKLAVPRPFDIYASQEVSESASVSGECSAIALASREDMIPPYVAITIDAEGNYVVGVARPTEDSYVVDMASSTRTKMLRFPVSQTMTLYDRFWPKAGVRIAGYLVERRTAIPQKRPYIFWLRKIQFELPLHPRNRPLS